MTLKRSYDWDGPAYYPESALEVVAGIRGLTEFFGFYFGPLRSGLWTVESMDKAIAWQARRRAGFPYIHRIKTPEMPEWPADAPAPPEYCWAVEGFGEPIYRPDHATAIFTVKLECEKSGAFNRSEFLAQHGQLS